MPESAEYWRDRAMEWAQAAGDGPMQGYVLLKKSQAAWDDGCGTDADAGRGRAAGAVAHGLAAVSRVLGFNGGHRRAGASAGLAESPGLDPGAASAGRSVGRFVPVAG